MIATYFYRIIDRPGKTGIGLDLLGIVLETDQV